MSRSTQNGHKTEHRTETSSAKHPHTTTPPATSEVSESAEAETPVESSATSESVSRAPADFDETSAQAVEDITGEDIRHTNQARDGFEAYAPRMLRTAEQNPADFGTAIDIAGAREHLKRYDALAADETAAREKLALIKRERWYHRVEAWKVTLEVYGKGQGVKRNAAVKKVIDAFKAFMATGPRPKKEEPKK